MSIQVTTEEVEILSRLFKHPAGSDARDLLKRKFCNALSYVKGDSFQTTFNEGQRGLALLLVACANASTQPLDVEGLDKQDNDFTEDK